MTNNEAIHPFLLDLQTLSDHAAISRQIINRIPDHETFVQVGNCNSSVFFDKPKTPCEVINDPSEETGNLFQQILTNEAEFDKSLWSTLALSLLLPIEMDELLSDAERAVRKYATNPHMLGSIFYLHAAIFERCRSLEIQSRHYKAVSERIEGTTVTALSPKKLVKSYDNERTLFYAEPSTPDEHRRLADLLKNIKGKCMIVTDDTSGTREMYAAFFVEQISLLRSTDNNRKPQDKLVFFNY